MIPAVPDEIWAAGVTYAVSDDIRGKKSGRNEFYEDVFEGERPEIFFKATPSRCGLIKDIRIRADSMWDVPKPELAVVVHRGTIVGYTISNNVSSRDIEGENLCNLELIMTIKDGTGITFEGVLQPRKWPARPRSSFRI